MNINELIEQIGRMRLEDLATSFCMRDDLTLKEVESLAQIALAVLDAKPVAFYANGAGRAALKDGTESVMPLYASTPSGSVPEVVRL